MKPTRKSIAYLMFLCVTGMLVVAVTGWDRAASGLVFEPQPYRLGEIGSSANHVVEVALRNGTGQAVQIVGARETCGPDGCVEIISGLPAEIPAGSMHWFKVHFRCGQPGPFEKAMVFYTTNPSQPEIEIVIAGICK